MKDVFQAIKHRRSVRSYLDKPVPRALIEQILDAGNWAPTGHNHQAFRFVVVQDQAFKRRLIEAARPVYVKFTGGMVKATDEFARDYVVELGPRCLGWERASIEETVDRLLALDDGVYWGAPVIIFVIATRGHREAECSAACQNMMLAADALGLGSCWSGFGSAITDDEEVVAALELQGNEKLMPSVVIGYPAIQPDPPPKQSPVVKWI